MVQELSNLTTNETDFHYGGSVPPPHITEVGREAISYLATDVFPLKTMHRKNWQREDRTLCLP